MPFGLPTLPSAITSGIATVVQDVVSLQNLLFPTPLPIYGIFDSGGNEALVGYASSGGFGFQRDQRIATAPQEQGAFTSFNKVALPFGAKLQYIVNGGAPAISAFLANVEALVQDTNLYAVVTPEYSWQSVNVTHHDFRRESRRGFSMFTVDVWLEEVRVTQPGQLSNSMGTQASGTSTAEPDGQAQQNGGTVQMNALGTTSDPFSSLH